MSDCCCLLLFITCQPTIGTILNIMYLYFRTPFKGYHGVTQGVPLSPTIFNVLVDTVLWHWVTREASTDEAVDPGVSGTEIFGRYAQHLAAYFYADYGIITSTWVARLQRAFDTLTELFDHMGLHINVENMASMDCRSCCALGGNSVEAYCLHMMGLGHTYR